MTDFIPQELLNELISAEAQRRLQLLGGTARLFDADQSALRQRASNAFISKITFFDYWKKYHVEGLNGLRPADWTSITESDYQIALDRLARLGCWAAADIITASDITLIASASGWSERQVRRWLRRYREAGLWGLIDGHDPAVKKPSDRDLMTRSDLGGIPNKYFEKMQDDYATIRPLLDDERTTTEMVRARAAEVGKSERWVWGKLRNFRASGFVGLGGKRAIPRSYQPRGLTPYMVDIVAAIKLANPFFSDPKICRRASEVAAHENMAAPSIPQVRRILQAIPEPLIDEARKKYTGGRYRKNSYTATRPYIMETGKIYDGLDYHHVNQKIANELARLFPDEPAKINPQLAMIVERSTGFIMRAILSYDVPDRFDPSTLLRDAYEKYGSADFLNFDQGSVNLTAYLDNILTNLLGVEPIPSAPASPTQNGVVERMFGVLEAEYLDEIRNLGRNATMEIVDQFLQKSVDRINDSVCKGDQESRRVLFGKLGRHPVDTEILNRMMPEEIERMVSKNGIQIEDRVYWWRDFGPYIGKKVLARMPPSYELADSIEVYFEGQHIGTADLVGGTRASSHTPDDIAHAKKAQRTALHQELASSIELWESDVRPILYDEFITKSTVKKSKKPTKKQDKNILLIDRISGGDNDNE